MIRIYFLTKATGGANLLERLLVPPLNRFIELFQSVLVGNNLVYHVLLQKGDCFYNVGLDGTNMSIIQEPLGFTRAGFFWEIDESTYLTSNEELLLEIELRLIVSKDLRLDVLGCFRYLARKVLGLTTTTEAPYTCTYLSNFVLQFIFDLPKETHEITASGLLLVCVKLTDNGLGKLGALQRCL
jgi:hypothetical protein